MNKHKVLGSIKMVSFFEDDIFSIPCFGCGLYIPYTKAVIDGLCEKNNIQKEDLKKGVYFENCATCSGKGGELKFINQ
jgi:hypothetical protein